MPSRSEQIEVLVQEILAGRHWYLDLDTCPEEDRPAVRKKILEVDGKISLMAKGARRWMKQCQL